MARRIVESGYPLVLWARRAESLAPFADTPAETASSIAELAARADHVGVCVVDDAGVEQVCDELIPAMRPGGRIAIHSTVHPNTVKALAARAAARGLALIDAPVSGGGAGAAARTLTVMIGGDEEVVAAARPIFETFGGLIVRVGGVGAGQTAKLVNNALMAAHVAMAHYGLSCGVGARPRQSRTQRDRESQQRPQLRFRSVCAAADSFRIRSRREIACQGCAPAR